MAVEVEESVPCLEAELRALRLPLQQGRPWLQGCSGSAKSIFGVPFPRGSKYPIFMESGPKYHYEYGFWNQRPQILGTWAPLGWSDIRQVTSWYKHRDLEVRDSDSWPQN